MGFFTPKRIAQKILILILIFSWIFSGWPQIPFTNFPPEIQKTQAAFPQVASLTESTFASGTSHNVAMPATVAAGDLLLLLLTNDGSATVTDPDGAGGWTEIATIARSTYVRGSVWAKDAVGDEDGTTVDFVTSADEAVAAQVYRILAADWYGDIADGVAQANAGGGANSVDPPSLSPAWGSDETLWVAYLFKSSTNAVTAYPASYTNGTNTNTGDTTANATAASARREVEAASEDPGAFTAGGSGSVFTVAVRPSAVAVPDAPTLYPDDGGSNQIAFNNTRQNDTTPIVRASATHTTTFDRFQVEFNSDPAFGAGTALTETFLSTYSSGTQYNLQTTGTLGLPTTDGATYYVRARASADSGTNYGAWSSGTWTYTYKSSGDPDWFQTTDEQFDTGALSSTQTSGSDSVEITPAGGDYTSQSCNVDGWAGQPSNCKYYASPYCQGAGTAPWSSDCTVDACAGTATRSASSGIRNIELNGTEFTTNDTTVTATVTFGCYSGTTAGFAVLYQSPGSGWVQVYEVYGSACTTEGAASPTNYQITIDQVVGTHYVRAIVSSTFTQGWTCANGNYSDNDDMSFTVVAPSGGESGTIMSPEIDFDWVSGQDTWGTAAFGTTETNGDVDLRVYYTVSTACDTIVPDGVLSGNSTGFDVSASPVNISGLTPVASTYNRICLQATLTDSGGTPFLNDWTVTWATVGGTITTDIVDASYVSVGSPTMVMNAATFDFTCQTVTGSFGTASQQIYVNNDGGADGGWTLTLAAQATTNVWDSAGTDYDFNDPTGSGCTDGADAGDTVGGQMTVDPSVATLAVGQCGACSTANVSKGSSAAFNEGTTDTITLLTATAASDDVGDWTLQGVSISQKIPAEQPAASDYDINMVLTVTAS